MSRAVDLVEKLGLDGDVDVGNRHERAHAGRARRMRHLAGLAGRAVLGHQRAADRDRHGGLVARRPSSSASRRTPAARRSAWAAPDWGAAAWPAAAAAWARQSLRAAGRCAAWGPVPASGGGGCGRSGRISGGGGGGSCTSISTICSRRRRRAGFDDQQAAGDDDVHADRDAGGDPALGAPRTARPPVVGVGVLRGLPGAPATDAAGRIPSSVRARRRRSTTSGLYLGLVPGSTLMAKRCTPARLTRSIT